MARKTPLYERHVALGARLVDFGGWDMPVSYGSQIEEHHAVRRHAGLFDVSHMRVVDLAGAGTLAFLRFLLANDVARLTAPGKALYSCMLAESGGVLDDLIVYRLADDGFRLVVNAGTADADLAWILRQAAGHAVEVTARADLGILALQGPAARALAARLLDARAAEGLLAVPGFAGAAFSFAGGDGFVGRTGYTGEDGFEFMLPVAATLALWDALLALGARACGLGARDTLRLEAGMNLYGNDMDATTTPFEAGLAWTVALAPARAFIGRAALEAQLAAGVPRRQVALLLEDKGVLRAHQGVFTADGAGEVTSGSYSPTLERSIALARVPAAGAAPPATVEVDVRGKRLRARVVKAPFVRHGQPLVAP